MKRFSKVCLILCLVCFVLGIMLTAGGAMLGGTTGEFSHWFGLRNIREYGFDWDFDWDDWNEWDNWDDEKVGNMTEYTFDQISELDLDIDWGELFVHSYEGKKIKVETNSQKYMDIYEDDGALVIDEKSNTISSFFRFSRYKNRRQLHIYLPKNYVMEKSDIALGAGSVFIDQMSADEVSLDVGAGEMTAVDIKAEKKVELNVGAGQMVIDNLKTKKLLADCGAGEIVLNGSIRGDSEISCGIGSVEVSLKEAEDMYNYRLECGLGEIEINDSSYSSISGSKTIKNNADYTMDLDCGIGEIVVDTQSESL